MEHDYNILTNDGHCKDDVANEAIRNVERDTRKKEKKIARRIFKRMVKYLNDFGYTLCNVSAISKKTGQLYEWNKNGIKKH